MITKKNQNIKTLNQIEAQKEGGKMLAKKAGKK